MSENGPFKACQATSYPKVLENGSIQDLILYSNVTVVLISTNLELVDESACYAAI